MRVSVIGLGKLGSPLAAVIAHRGHTVVGVDRNREFVRRINEGRAPVEEPGLQPMIDGCRGRLSIPRVSQSPRTTTSCWLDSVR